MPISDLCGEGSLDCYSLVIKQRLGGRAPVSWSCPSPWFGPVSKVKINLSVLYLGVNKCWRVKRARVLAFYWCRLRF